MKKLYRLNCHNSKTGEDQIIKTPAHDISKLVKFLGNKGIMVIDAKEIGDGWKEVK